jgi:transposase-like protein
VLTDEGALALEVPRDRDGTFEPQIIPKHARRVTGFDDKILALYARGMTVREIQGLLTEMYAVEVSPDLISTVTDAVQAEVTAWQTRPLEPMYPVVFFDALRVKIRDEATVRSKAIDLALAVLPDGSRDILGLWIEQTEGAKFWMKVFSDLKARGCQDILIAVTDGLKGMSEALAAVFPETTLQTCIVPLMRQSLDFANWKERKPMAAKLRTVDGRRVPTRPVRRSTPLSEGRGARTFRPSWPRGAAPGPTGFRSSPFRPRSGASSTRPTRWSASTRSSGRSSSPGATFRPMKRPRS